MKRLCLIGILCLFLPPHAAFAVRVPGLYEAEVPVAGQQAEHRREAVETAMKRVLVKLTGDRNAGGQAALAPIIKDAEKYVQQYRYVESPVRVTGGVEPAGVPETRLMIRFRFDDANLNNALRGLGVQVWGRERPAILVWLAMEDGDFRRLLVPEEDTDIFSVVTDAAGDRGIVLIYPLFDLQDTSSLRASDIWGGFQRPVLEASSRYFPDIVLTGRISSPVPGIWEGRWTAYLGEERTSWSTEGSFVETVVGEGIDGIADLLARRYARGSDTDTGATRMKVVDVTSLEEYARVLKYLQSLSPVTRVDVVEVGPGDVEFSLTAHGGGQAVAQAINFGRVLEPLDGAGGTYRLLP